MFELRDYQRPALAKLWKYWRAGGGNPLIDLATGVGKSFLIAELGRRFCSQGRRVLVLREIIQQDQRALRTPWPDIPAGVPGINCAGLGQRDTGAPILLASVQSVYRRPQVLGRRDLILVDETHAVDLIALLRPAWSPALFVQMLGRSTRKADRKANCLLLDFAGNVMRHGPVDTVTGESPGEARDRGEAPRAKVCPKCKSLVPPATKVCPDYGHASPVKIPQHDVRVATIAPLSTAITWLTVLGCSVEEHFKPGRPPSLRIDFWTGRLNVSNWLAFEHGDGARWHAKEKWRLLGGLQPAPTTVADALARQHEISSIAAIGVQRDGEYWRVVDVRLAPPMRSAA